MMDLSFSNKVSLKSKVKTGFIRITALSMSLIMFTTLFLGCSRKNADDEISEISLTTKDPNLNVSGFPVVKEKIQLTGVGARVTIEDDWNKLPVFLEYEKMTNISIKWETYPQESFAQKRDQLIASGNLPDLYIRAYISTSDELKYGTDGTFIPLNDLIKKYAPAFMGISSKDPDVIRNITKGDGKIYTLPQLREPIEPRTPKIWINKKWLDKLELKVPTTTDELFDVLKAFKDRDPNNNGQQDEVPFTGDLNNYGSNFMSFFLGYWGFGNTSGMLNNFIDVNKDGKIRFIAEDPRYEEVLMYFNKLWSEGLIDKNFFNMNTAVFGFRIQDGVIGCAPGNYDNSWLGKYQDDYVALSVLKGPYGDQIHNVVTPFVQLRGTSAITKNNKYPEATMRWIDYLYTVDGSNLFRMGIEGKTYTKLPDGRLEYTNEILKSPRFLNWNQAIARYTIGTYGTIPQLITYQNDKYVTPENIEFTKPLINYMSKEYVYPPYTQEEIDELNGELSELIKYMKNMSYKFIVGDESFSNWDKYQEKLKELKSERYKQIYEDVYRRWKGTK